MAARRRQRDGVRIVGIGGGTGLPVLLAGLRRLARGEVETTPAGTLNVTAIVSVADNGGSSGRLRDSLHLPAVGDLRKCVGALAEDRAINNLFQHRFLSDDGLHGHALGNLMLAAMCQQSGSLAHAVDEARALLDSAGRVLPVTESAVDICAQLEDGSVVRGEVNVAASGKRIVRAWLEPVGDEQPTAPGPGVLEAIAEADVILLGPGSLYTSIVPNLAVPGVADALRETLALRVLICNLMTQPGETDGFSASDHIRVVEQHIGERVLDVCIVHAAPKWPPLLPSSSSAREADPVRFDREEIIARNIIPLVADVAAAGSDRVRHDPIKLANVIAALVARVFPRGESAATNLQVVK